MKRIISLILACIVSLTCFSTAAFAESSKDFEIVRERIREYLFTHPSWIEKYEDSWLESLGHDGKFSDFDYNELLPRFEHTKRLASMSWNYALPQGKLYKNHEAAGKIIAGLRFFVEQRWLAAEVGLTSCWSGSMESPMYLADVFIALEAGGTPCPQELLDICIEHHFDLHNRPENYSFVYSTSNVAFTTNLWKRLAYLLRDEKYLKLIYEESSKNWFNHTSGEYGVMQGSEGEDLDFGGRGGVSYFGDGYYPDGTYYGHGPFPYTHGYGGQFLSNNVELIPLVAGTKYQVSQDKLSVLVDVLLESMRWLTRGDVREFITDGRNASGPTTNDNVLVVAEDRSLGGGITRYISWANALLAEPNIPKKAELEDFVKKLNENLRENKGTSYVEGNKHFWISDYMAHHREGYAAMVRFPSIRNMRTERVGNAGVLNYHISDGSLQLYVTGNEYAKALDVWDWERVPGVTAINTAGDPPPVPDSGVIRRPDFFGTSEFCGGVSDGDYGAATMEFNNGAGVDMKNSWFFFDDEVVALGTDIRTTASGELYTNLNQCLLDGAVVYGNGDTENTLSVNTETNIGNANWVYHGQIGYIIPEEGKNVFVSNIPQSGNSSRQDMVSEKKVVTRDIFSMYINHGRGVRDGKFSYIAVPGATKEEVKAYAKDIPVVIVQNDNKIQAVYHKKLNILQAVFREEGEITLENGLKVAVDTPCVVMVKPIDGGYAVSVQNPKNQKFNMALKINEKFEMDNVIWDEKTQMSTINITNRNGIYAGETVTTNLTTKLISNISYNKENDCIDFDGTIPAKNAKYVYVKITDKNGKTYLKAAEISQKSTYDFSYATNELPAGKYKVELYCENNMESLFDEVVIEKTIPDAPVIFWDTTNHWCRDYAARMALYGIVKGDGNGYLRPDENISLAELLQILISSAESCNTGIEPFYQGFDTWEDAIIKYATRNELLPQEIIDIGIKAKDPVNRQEMITILMNAAEKYGWLTGYKGETVETPADIVFVNYWAYSAVESAIGLGIVQGNENGISPFDYSKRAECIKIIEKLISQFK